MELKYLTRHKDILPPNKTNSEITIIGAGAIGSFTALSLAKMGFENITVYDFDEISDENMNCQFYPINSIGKKKVEVLKDLIKDFTGVEIKALDKRVESGEVIMGDFLIAAVDSMEVRKEVFETVNAAEYLIDPRMGAEYATMNILKIGDTKKAESYARTLYSDAEAVQERCTAKSTIYTVMLIAGQISKAVKDICMGSSFIENMDWSIESNTLVSFSNEGRKL